MLRTLLLRLVIALNTLCCYAQDGSLDFSFGKDGIVTTSFAAANDIVNSVLIQNDNKIILAGRSANNLALSRYNSNGRLDSSFGINGKLTTNIGCANASGSACVLQPDGKIVVGGYCGIFPNYDFALARYNVNGTLDSSFGGYGIVVTPILKGGDQAAAVVMQKDDKIILGGSTDNGSNSDLALVRYKPDGSLDSSFGTNGIVSTAVGTAGDIIRSVAMQSDGKIVVAGFSYTSLSFSYDFVLVRYTENGRLDSSFAQAGIRTTAIRTNTNDYAESIVIQDDDKIVVGGYSFTGYLLLAQYDTKGNLDESFGIGGTVSIPFSSAYQNKYALALQSDGKFLMTGYSASAGAYSHFQVQRFTAQGAADSTFGIMSVARFSIGTRDDIATSLAIQKDGKIVVAGSTNNGTNFDFAMIRLNNATSTGIDATESSNRKLKFHPNPFTQLTTLHVPSGDEQRSAKLYNSFGQLVQHIWANDTEITLHRYDLCAGLYFVQLVTGGAVVFTEKLLIID